MEENLHAISLETRLTRFRDLAGKLLEKLGALQPTPLPEANNDTQSGLPERRDSQPLFQQLGCLPIANF